jgi:hypothetical protein
MLELLDQTANTRRAKIRSQWGGNWSTRNCNNLAENSTMTTAIATARNTAVRDDVVAGMDISHSARFHGQFSFRCIG